jgi:hypothetical protein
MTGTQVTDMEHEKVEATERIKLLEPTLKLGKTKLRVSWDIRLLWSGGAVAVHFICHCSVNINHNISICFTAHNIHFIQFMKNNEVNRLSHRQLQVLDVICHEGSILWNKNRTIKLQYISQNKVNATSVTNFTCIKCPHCKE